MAVNFAKKCAQYKESVLIFKDKSPLQLQRT